MANDEESTAASERSPLLDHQHRSSAAEPDEETWEPPGGFIWIELAIFANVFLYAFDATITAATYAVISSSFDAANAASWLTTSYLVTSTAFQPLYGRFSDIFGRRVCFFFATTSFGLGCLGCGLAQDIVTINLMRALAGFGGGGLMSLATIINSDMIPFRRRGMYQALQNTIYGVGAIAGASFGGAIADTIGWRWCFLLQVPVSMIALILGWFVIKNPRLEYTTDGKSSWQEVWARVDFAGAILLVAALSAQLVALSVGGNELPWSSPWVVGLLVVSTALLAAFFVVEARTTAHPIIPLRMFKRKLSWTIQLTNLCAGIAAYAVSILAESVATDKADLDRSICLSCHCSSKSSCLTLQPRLGLVLPFHPLPRLLEASLQDMSCLDMAS